MVATAEIHIPTPFEQLLSKRLICTSPEYVAVAAEWLANRDLDPINAAFLRTGIIQDSRVENDTRVS